MPEAAGPHLDDEPARAGGTEAAISRGSRMKDLDRIPERRVPLKYLPSK